MSTLSRLKQKITKEGSDSTKSTKKIRLKVVLLPDWDVNTVQIKVNLHEQNICVSQRLKKIIAYLARS